MRAYAVVSLKRGLASFTRRDLVALAGSGHEVVILPTKVAPGAATPALIRVVYAGKVRRLAAAFAGFLKVLRQPRGAARFWSAMSAGEPLAFLLACAFYAGLPRPDVVYAIVGDRKLFTGYYLSLLWDCPLTVTVHAYELYNNPNPRLFVTALKRCSRVITVTEHNRDRLVAEWGVSAEKIDVVRVSVDTILFAAGERFVILIVGSVGYIKGHASLFEAVRLLDDPAVEVWVVGGAAGAHPRDPESLAREYGVESQCVFLGWQSEAAVAALMRRADVLCAPSRQDPSGNLEGFPTVLAEAMFVGLPVVTTAHAEIPAVVSATVVREDSPRELAAALRHYMDSAEARSADAAANREIAQRLFAGDATRRLCEVLELVAAATPESVQHSTDESDADEA